jgi:hypothetical protein
MMGSVSVVSTSRAQSVPDELRRQADFFVDIEELRTILTREHGGADPAAM